MLLSLRSRARLAGAALLLAASAACSSSTAPVDIDGVTAVSRDGTVRVTNGTTVPVFTAVFGRNQLALLDWVMCVDAAVCPPLAPGATLVVPAPANEREAVVYWWRAARAANGAMVPIDFHSAVLEL